jgi:hypothetical protein
MFLYDLLDWNLRGIGEERVFGVAFLPFEEHLRVLSKLELEPPTPVEDWIPFARLRASGDSSSARLDIEEVFSARRRLDWIVHVSGCNPFLDSTEMVLGRLDIPPGAKWRARRLPDAAWMFRQKAQFDWLAFFKSRADTA